MTVNTDTKVIYSTHKRNSSLYYDSSRNSEGGGLQIKSSKLKDNADFKESKGEQRTSRPRFE